VITNALMGNGSVVAPVYVAGYAPEAGESATDLLERFPGGTLRPTLAPPAAAVARGWPVLDGIVIVPPVRLPAICASLER
jgi:hypothetical protein